MREEIDGECELQAICRRPVAGDLDASIQRQSIDPAISEQSCDLVAGATNRAQRSQIGIDDGQSLAGAWQSLELIHARRGPCQQDDGPIHSLAQQHLKGAAANAARPPGHHQPLPLDLATVGHRKLADQAIMHVPSSALGGPRSWTPSTIVAELCSDPARALLSQSQKDTGATIRQSTPPQCAM